MRDGEKERTQVEALYLAYKDSIFRLCLMYLKDRQRAEDAMQETFLRVWKRWETYRGESSERTWLSAIAVNVCRDWLRTPWLRLERKRIPWDERLELRTDRQRDIDVVRAVMALPIRLREVIALRYYQGMTVQETAQTLGLSASGVNARLAKAKARLRPELWEVYFDA